MTNGPVTCRVRLDRGGYVPGEAISIWATITNNSSVTIKHTRASLTEVSNEYYYMPNFDCSGFIATVTLA